MALDAVAAPDTDLLSGNAAPRLALLPVSFPLQFDSPSAERPLPARPQMACPPLYLRFARLLL
jgi:hypothetical protein